VRILVLNWQDSGNPQAGGAELHLKQIFSRIVARGHSVDLLCSGWANVPNRVELDGIEVYRVGTRHTYPFLAKRYYSRHLATKGYDVVIEDLNKVPLYTPLWDAKSWSRSYTIFSVVQLSAKHRHQWQPQSGCPNARSDFFIGTFRFRRLARALLTIS